MLMFKGMTLEDFQKYASKGRRVVVYKEAPADLFNPVFIYQALRKEAKGAFILESNERNGQVGRYTFLGFNPFLIVSCKDGRTTITRDGKIEHSTQDPLTTLRGLFKENQALSSEVIPPLVGGAVGFMSYDACRLFETLPNRHKDTEKYPDIHFGFYNTMIAFDHATNIVYLTHVVDPKNNPRVHYREAMEYLTDLMQKILSYRLLDTTSLSVYSDAQSREKIAFDVDVSDKEYQNMVRAAQRYIKAGDIFQVVLSRNFSTSYCGDPFSIYRALRMINPSPYMFYLDNIEYTILGASPERLVSLHDNIIESMPIAGTRPRAEGMQDIALEKELLNDPKEIAEHMMLVDLARNDIGRIAIPGSVHVADLKIVQRFSHVMHITSRVKGTLAKGYDALDALRCALPAGTLSGAPKIRAMEIIDELEHSRRGVYGGAICYIDNRGFLDSCIAIRMACVKDQKVHIRAGGGIVLDSNPQTEADESRHKAEGMLEAIRVAGGGL